MGLSVGNVTLVLVIVFSAISSVQCQFFDCHDDPTSDPPEGDLKELEFTWLGLLQYIHVKNATPHYFRIPRVVLISRQFALSTAVDAAQVPDEYALGNVVFADYERDEAECEVRVEDLAHGASCDPAIVLMPIADVLLHPEYKHFKAADSIAILKLIMPVKSYYVVPACLPFKNYIYEKTQKRFHDKLYHIDFINDVPRDFLNEEKQVIHLHVLPRELCYLYDDPDNGTYLMKNRKACTTGCNFHSGAPTLVHEHTGHWTLVSISEGGTPCPDPLRPRRPPSPPRHILLFPYVPWITAAITGKAVGAFAKDDPFGYVMPRAKSVHDLSHQWNGHYWMGGLRCFDRGDAASDLFKFYHEVFQVKPSPGLHGTYVAYFLEIYSPMTAAPVCCKIGMPYRLGQPKVTNLDSPIVKIEIPTLAFQTNYRFVVQMFAYNVSDSETSSDESETTSESVSYDG